MAVPDRHLDLGCGEIPRNPYSRSHVCGVDVRPLAAQGAFEYKVANLFLDPIPYDDNSFGSVSAYDFIEHVPRILPTADGGSTTFPFIRLMNEIWRVLAPGGRFYALTPAYPNAEAFTDPTHVNIVTEQTHTYFCGDPPLGRMYGFNGSFRALDLRRVYRSDAYSAIAGSAENNSHAKRFSRKLRSLSRWLRGKQASLKPAYLLWELEAIKPAR
jgi:SAM-dependent methyltransferase